MEPETESLEEVLLGLPLVRARTEWKTHLAAELRVQEQRRSQLKDWLARLGAGLLLIFAAHMGYQSYTSVVASKVPAAPPAPPPLVAALDNDDKNLLEACLQADPQALERVNEQGYTPLHFSFLKRRPALFRLLLDKGARVEVKSRAGRSLLRDLLVDPQGFPLDEVLARGAREFRDPGESVGRAWEWLWLKRPELFVKVVSLTQMTGLDWKQEEMIRDWFAVLETGKPEAVQALLEHGAPVNYVTGRDGNSFDREKGVTPLVFSLWQSQYDNCEVLLSHGADPSLGHWNAWDIVSTIEMKLIPAHDSRLVNGHLPLYDRLVKSKFAVTAVVKARLAIQAAKDREGAALERLDGKGGLAAHGESWLGIGRDGKVTHLKDEQKSVKSLLATVRSLHQASRIYNFELMGDRAKLNSMSWVEVKLPNPRTGKLSTATLYDMSEEIWRKTPRGWRQLRNKTTWNEVSVDGKKVVHRGSKR